MNEVTDGIVVGGPVSETGVCLAIYGTELDPDVVTRQLMCKPSSAHRRGDRRSPSSAPFRTGAWLLGMRGMAPTTAEHLIRQLLMRVPSDSAVWEHLAREFDVQVRVAVHLASWNEGFELSPETIALIGTLRAKLVFDLYAHGDAEEAGPR